VIRIVRIADLARIKQDGACRIPGIAPNALLENSRVDMECETKAIVSFVVLEHIPLLKV
jgi:hypothetical protein